MNFFHVDDQVNTRTSGSGAVLRRVEFVYTLLSAVLAGLETTADTAAELGPDTVQRIVDKLGSRNTAGLAKKLGGDQTGQLVTDMGPGVTSDVVQGFGPELTAQIVLVSACCKTVGMLKAGGFQPASDGV